MKFKKSLTLALIIISSITIATATAEMSLFPQESTTEINSFTSFEVNIENTGNVEDVYTLSSEESQVTVAPTQVRLDAGGSETVHAWYNPDRTQEAGSYSFTVESRSRATGETSSVGGMVNVVTDHEVNIETQPNTQTTCLGEPTGYNIHVTNDGIQAEEFQLSTEIGELTEDKVELQPRETGTVTLSVSSDEPMERNFNVIAASTTSYAEDHTQVQFIAENCYDSEVSVEPESQEVAAHTEAFYEVTVENLGTRADEFELTTDTGTLMHQTIGVNSGEEFTTGLVYTPEELGNQQITVEAQGISQSSATAEMEVYNGMDVNLDFDQEETYICEDQSLSRTMTIENTGEAAENYELETNRGELSETEGSLQPGQQAEVELNVDQTELEEEEIGEVEVTAVSTTFGEPVETATTSFVVENCWDLELDVVPQVMSAGENRSVVYEVHMENTGTRENTYRLTHGGPEWLDIRPDEKTVASGETETAHMYAGIPFMKEGELEIPIVVEGHETNATQTVTLLIGEELQEAIRDERNLLTGRFTERLGFLSEAVGEMGDIQRIVLSVVIGLAITVAVLYRT